MDKNVLIYFNEYHLKPIGGPAGYLYNLKNELDNKKITNIHFIPGEDKNKKKKELLHKMPKIMQRGYYFIKRTKNRKDLLSNHEKMAVVDFKKYDIIHFHSTISLYKCKDSLKDYNGKVILTSHSPKPMFLELYEDNGLFKLEKKLLKRKYLQEISKIDEFAFNRADYIIFPCEEAEEPYYNNWEKYKEIKDQNKHKYRYLLTGIKSGEVKTTKEDYRSKYNIPQDAFVISYVGRHNETKGYSILKTIANEVLEDNDNYFLIGGKEEPLKGLKNKKWIEVGWTNEPHSLINSSNIFILPNKETYFDLIMLEILSLGKIVIASNTGGNKFFKKINAEGIFLYNDIEELKTLINKVKSMSVEEKNILERKNRNLYEENFTKEIFTRNYINLIEGL